MIHWSSVSWGFVGYPMWQRFRGPWQMRTNRASEDFGDFGEMVLLRLTACVGRVTLDFDGSVIGTSRYAEGTAVPQEKRTTQLLSLFCTVAQTARYAAPLGNVHDSNGAKAFISACSGQNSQGADGRRLFQRYHCHHARGERGDYTVTPFERLVELKQITEARSRWYRLSEPCAYFELAWKPKSWARRPFSVCAH